MNKILIVEDNERNLKLFRDILASRGYETLVARNGAEGVMLAREEVPALILMDIQMPVMDGRKALQILRESNITRDIPVIAVTSFAMSEDMARIREDGFDNYMSKPVDLKAFMKMVEETLKKSRIE